ncbi:GNAT family N-acetyltransferase [Inquilinus sp. KBS0705]|nr:GNAT family N-acetyltransferase [Inquilinus sp. KBS0705]
MVIRLATLTDIPQIMQIIAEVVPLMRAAGNMQWDSTYPNPDVFRQDIELGQLWVADIEGDIAGVTAITTEQYPEYEQVGWDTSETAIVTHRLAVSPRHRGKGIAEALLLQADKVAAERGINLVRVDTNSQNAATQRLFPKVGYTFGGEITLAFRPGLSFYVYEKRL